MNFQLEMNTIEKSVIRHVAAFNTCIGAENPQEFAWIADNINDFRTQSMEIYQRLLSAFLRKTGWKLYAYDICTPHQNACFAEIPIHSFALSFLDQCNRFIAVLSENAPSSSCFNESSEKRFEILYEQGYALFEIHDFFIEGNSMTFYCHNCEVLSQLEEIAETIGFVKTD